MTKMEAVKTVVNGDKANIADLKEAREIITDAMNNGYVLVDSGKLMKLLQSVATKEMAALIYNEVTA